VRSPAPSTRSGPAWPRSAGTDIPKDWHDDGGESLDPRVPAEVAALEEPSDDEEEVADEAVEDTADAAATPDEKAADKPAADQPSDEILFEEEIIIEGEAAHRGGSAPPP